MIARIRLALRLAKRRRDRRIYAEAAQRGVSAQWKRRGEMARKVFG